VCTPPFKAKKRHVSQASGLRMKQREKAG